MPEIKTSHGPGTIENPFSTINKEEKNPLKNLFEIICREKKAINTPNIDTLKVSPTELKWNSLFIARYVDAISNKKPMQTTYGKGYPEDKKPPFETLEERTDTTTEFLNPEQATMLISEGYRPPVINEHTIIYIPIQNLSLITTEPSFVSAHEQNDMLPIGSGYAEAPPKKFIIKPGSHIAKQIKEKYNCEDFAVTPVITTREKDDLELIKQDKKPKEFWPSSREFDQKNKIIKAKIKNGQTWVRMALLTK